MNPTSLYVSTCRLVLQADVEDPDTWTDLYRLVPYLRQSLSCIVCTHLLIEPQTPRKSGCLHHVCRMCKGGRKKIKPTCQLCKDCTKYEENVQLRMLLQCYKKLCEYVTSTPIYMSLLERGSDTDNFGTTSLINLIQEGAGYKDNFKCTAGLTKSEYSILPCVYTNSSTQTLSSTTTTKSLPKELKKTSLRSVSNGSPLYSVLYAGRNKITIKRKNSENETAPHVVKEPQQAQPSTAKFKKPSQRRNNGKRKGCRCGNATPTPGKLTCCGQRCPCYVDNKSCSECRCRGCRNPHSADGYKVRSHMPPVRETPFDSTILSDNAVIETPPNLNFDSNIEVMGIYNPEIETETNLQNTFLMTADSNPHLITDTDDSSEIDVV